jgi:hypothetical protein
MHAKGSGACSSGSETKRPNPHPIPSIIYLITICIYIYIYLSTEMRPSSASSPRPVSTRSVHHHHILKGRDHHILKGREEMEQLPDDMLVEILSRLPPSSLAASRCVSKHLCSIVDARRLLRAGHLLPLRLDAFYCISLASVDRETYLFARPSVARRIPGACLDFRVDLEVVDHCNGLLLLCDMVFRLLNPATRQSAALPKAPDPSIENMLGVATVWAGTAPNRPPFYLFTDFNLVYDPMAESPEHFEVFLIPVLLCGHSGLMSDNITINLEEQEWPPSTYRTHVFSSRSWRWEERSWVRQGEPTGTMADMLRSEHGWNHKAVYFRGALYVHYSNESVMRYP